MSDIFTVHDLNLWYGSTQALHHVDMDIPEQSITALIGPSGCGKSTFLKTLDRMNDLVPGVRIEGTVEYDGKNIFAPDVDVNELRRQVGMVFQKPNPFPMSIYDNITYGPRLHGVHNKAELDELVEKTFEGSLPAFIAAFARKTKLSQDEVDRLRAMIDGYEEKRP